MSGHNTREEIAISDPMVTSVTDGETLADINVYGMVFNVIETGDEKTRKIPSPKAVGQQVIINVTLSADTDYLDIMAPSSGTWNGVDDTLRFTRAAATTELWAVLFSLNIGGTLVWRILAKGAGVTLPT